MDGQSEWLLCTLIKFQYGLFSYALQPAKRTRASFMGAILEEYLVTGRIASQFLKYKAM